ncbi:MAG: hypothetical protein AB8G77_07255 [Rhodothermales bacterium]
MALTQVCDRKKRLLVTTFRGEISGQEIMDAYTRIYMQPMFDETFHQLWDCRYVDRFVFDTNDMAGIKQLATTFCPGTEQPLGKIAIIASNEEIIDSAKDIIASTGEHARKKILFNSLEEGLDWLGIENLPAYLLN